MSTRELPSTLARQHSREAEAKTDLVINQIEGLLVSRRVYGEDAERLRTMRRTLLDVRASVKAGYRAAFLADVFVRTLVQVARRGPFAPANEPLRQECEILRAELEAYNPDELDMGCLDNLYHTLETRRLESGQLRPEMLERAA